MTFKSEKTSDGQITILRLSGRIQAEHLAELESQFESSARTVLNLEQVMLVDLPTVRFLARCEREGVELRHCPSFVRKWIEMETRHR